MLFTVVEFEFLRVRFCNLPECFLLNSLRYNLGISLVIMKPLLYLCVLATLAQAFINAWCFLPMFTLKLNIDLWKWSQDMWVLKAGTWKSKDPPLIRTEIDGGFLFQFMFLLLPASSPVMFRVHKWREHFLYFDEWKLN